MAYADSLDVKAELIDVLSGSFKYDSLIDSLLSIASDYIDDLHGHAATKEYDEVRYAPDVEAPRELRIFFGVHFQHDRFVFWR